MKMATLQKESCIEMCVRKGKVFAFHSKIAFVMFYDLVYKTQNGLFKFFFFKTDVRLVLLNAKPVGFNNFAAFLPYPELMI